MLALTTAIGAGLVVAGYNSMAPKSQLYGRTYTGNPQQKRQIALTYDDGPNDPHTFRLLEALEKAGARATFFMIGKYVDLRPDIARAVADAGHTVGNHTYTHPNLIFRSEWQLRDEVARCDRALHDAVGDRRSKLFRPPFGGRRPVTLRTVCQMSFTPVMWSVTAFDWSAKSPDTIERHVTKGVRGGDVVLLHDGGHLAFGTDRSFTVEATARVLQRYQTEGYEFKTITEMMAEGQTV